MFLFIYYLFIIYYIVYYTAGNNPGVVSWLYVFIQCWIVKFNQIFKIICSNAGRYPYHVFEVELGPRSGGAVCRLCMCVVFMCLCCLFIDFEKRAGLVLCVASVCKCSCLLYVFVYSLL